MLGPLLFMIYVNDLFKASNPLIKVIFADDTNLFLSYKNIDTLFASINVELENVSTLLKSKNCVWMLTKQNGCYFILSQKGSYFHRL